MFECLDDDDLRRTCGGIQMRLTQYGYPGDPDSDSDTRAGRGAYRHLDNNSMAITDSGLAALGLNRQMVTRQQHWVDVNLSGKKGGGTLTRRIDDRAPQREYRADLYMPRGYNHSYPDYADVSLHRGG